MLGRLAPTVQPPRFRRLTVGGIGTLLAVTIVSEVGRGECRR